MTQDESAAVASDDDPFNDVLTTPFLPPPPELLLKLDACDGELQKITELIVKDPAVSVNVLKVINSPAFGLSQQINSVERAVVLLGVNSVKSLTHSVLLRASVGNSSAEMVGVWNSAEETAVVCSLLSRQLKVWSTDRAYMLGLFHNCGIAVLLNKFPNYLEVIRAGYALEEESSIEAEDRAADTNHCVVGGLLAKNWKLPGELQQVIRAHHDQHALNKGIGELSDGLYLLKMAEDIANVHVTLGHQAVNHEWLRIQEAALLHFGLSDFDYEDMKDTIRNETSGVH